MRTDRLTRDLLIVLLVAVLAVAAWRLSFVLLLGFGGALLAVLFRGLAVRIARRTPLPVGAALAAVILGIGGALAAVLAFAGPRLGAEVAQLSRDLPATLSDVEDRLARTGVGGWLVDEVGATSAEPDVMGAIGGTLSTALGVLVNVVILVSVSVFLAADPDLYRRGALHLVPPAHRRRAGEVLDATGRALWRWLAGQAVVMAIVAVLTGTGLWLLGIPLPLLLGLLAGLTNFIPYAGPFLSGIPAVLVAFSQSPMDAVWTALLFVAVQQMEGNVLLPLVQKRAVQVPPVLIVLAVVGFGVLLGPAGVILATPLLIVTMVLVRMLWVEDALGDRAVEDAPGAR